MELNLESLITPGLNRKETFIVEDTHTASHLGSGSSRVLATPWMIAFMERTCHHLLAEKLPKGYSSVGIMVNIRHLAPCAVGSVVEIEAKVTSVNGLKVLFTVNAQNGTTLIGDGTHERFVINEERFIRKLNNPN